MISLAAQTAVDLFCHYAARAAGQLAPDFKWLDVLVFIARIGEHQPLIRHKIADALTFLSPEIHVIRTNEELIIASQTKQIIV